MSDRFDLEQQILECWKVTDDIRAVLDHGKDDMAKNFEALARLTDIRFEKLWFIFEQMCNTRQFTDGPAEVKNYDEGSFPDDGPLTEDQIAQLQSFAVKPKKKGKK